MRFRFALAAAVALTIIAASSESFAANDGPNCSVQPRSLWARCIILQSQGAIH